MLRPCPKCGNRNHISAFVCPCGNRFVGWQESAKELQPELEKAVAAPTESRQNIFPINSPSLPEQLSPQTSRESALEMQKQAIREALLAEELESRKPANGKLKVGLQKTLAGAGLLFVIGALLVMFNGFANITENSEGKQDQNKRASLTDASLAPDARYLAANNPADKNSFQGKVVDVGSGDTITVADKNNQEYQIKLEGIDAPELEQGFGREAQRNLFTLVFGKTVQVSLQEAGVDNLTVGKVLLNGKDISLEQLKAGLAWHDENDAFEQSENYLYAFNETDARSGGLGLWAAANPLPPWNYRDKADRNQGENQLAASNINGETPKAALNAKSKTKTIVEETRNATESQRPATETAPKPAFVKSPKSETIPPSPKVSTSVFTGYERKTIITPRNSTARCGDGTLSYSATRSGACAGRGGVADWFDGLIPLSAETATRPRKYNPALPRVSNCFIIKDGKKVYLDPAICGN